MLSFLFADLFLTVSFIVIFGLSVFFTTRESMAGVSWLIGVSIFISTVIDWWNAPSEWTVADLTVINWIISNPLQLIGWLALYTVIGIIYATVKWFLYVRKKAPSQTEVTTTLNDRKAANRRFYRKDCMGEKPKRSLASMLPGGKDADEAPVEYSMSDEEVDAAIREDRDYGYPYPKTRPDMTLEEFYMSTEYSMHPRNHYDRLVLWWFLWAPALFWDLFDNPIKLVADFVFETFGGMFLRMSVAASQKKG